LQYRCMYRLKYREMRLAMNNLPQDPVMLLSFLNMKLRDRYDSLESLADDLEIGPEEMKQLTEKLAEIGYHYDTGRNAFV